MIRDLLVLGAMTVALPVMTQQAPPPTVSVNGEDEDTYVGEAPERYVQVRLVEGSATVRKGDVDEALTRGIPLTEGDVVESRGRGVLQLADGSRVIFGQGARFTIASLFVERKEARQVVFRLERGHLSVQVGRNSEAQFRIETPAGRGTLAGGDCASFEVDADRSVRLKVFTGRIQFANSADRAALVSGERLTIYGDQDRLTRIRDFNTFELEAFDRWADAQFAVTRGASRERLPADIRAFGDDLDENGEWINVDGIGWCWRPTTGVDEDWRPYYRGRWAAYAGGMTWISDDPWGYVTHHHGRWGWHVSFGWYWIPGTFFSPAWVAFNSYDTYFGWAPLGYWNTPCTWGHRHWHGGIAWNIIDHHRVHYPHLNTHIVFRPEVIRPFNVGPSGSSARLTPPWSQRPLIVRPGEFRDPGQFRTVVQPGTQVSRFRQVVRDTPGRIIMNRLPEHRGDVPAERRPFTSVMSERKPVIRELGRLDGRRDGSSGPGGRAPEVGNRPDAVIPNRLPERVGPNRNSDHRGDVVVPNRLPERRQDEVRREERPVLRPRPDTEPHRFAERPRGGDSRPSESPRMAPREVQREAPRRETPRESSRSESRPSAPPARVEARPSNPPPRSESNPRR